LPFHSAIERLLIDWLDHTNGDFQILAQPGQVIVGRHSGQAAPVKTTVLPVASVTPSLLSSVGGSKPSYMVTSVAQGMGQVEVKASIKGVAAFSFLVAPSQQYSCGEVFRIACSHVGEAVTSNVWSNRIYGFSVLMNLLTDVLSRWVETNQPSVSSFLSYLLTYTDLYKTNCCTCGKWLIEDGAFGALPPLYHVSGSTPNARRHFSCPPP